MIVYASACDGIGAVHEAWRPLGWRCAWTSEIEPFPAAVVEHHNPGLPNLGDLNHVHESEVFRATALDLLVGGTPCQSFSVAGLRRGMDDPRGNLALVFLGLVDRARPRWVVWENVPGVLSSWSGPDAPSDLEPGQEREAKEASDFGCFIAGLEQLGYGVFWRVLDAQFFGLAQRRKRVLVVGHIGGAWQRAAAVLLERSSLSGHPAPRREAGQAVAALTASGVGTCGADDNQDQAGHLIPAVAGCLTARHGKGPDSDCTQTLIAFDTTQITSGENRSNPQPGDPCHTLPAHGAPPAVAYGFRHRASANDNAPVLEESTPTLRSADDDGTSVVSAFGVRRLMPIECERLQGARDRYTAITYRGKPAADAPRYKALGNSMAIKKMAWLGRRIALVDAIPG